MKIDLNDPRITAFALGELHGDDAAEMAKAIRTDNRIRDAVEQVRATSFSLLESLHGEADMLTAGQRDSVRRASSEPVIEEISSARIPFWKHPATAGLGVAAAVAIGLYITIGNPANEGGDSVVDNAPVWDWSKVSTEELTAPSMANDSPAPQGHGVSSSPGDRSQLTEAIQKSPEDYRQEVAKRIAASTSEDIKKLPATTPSDPAWLDVSEPSNQSLTVPLTTGAASWPWLERYVLRESTLPPRHTVRIEELINHFDYSPPADLQEGGVSGDIEISRTPWNASTCLVAVHVRSGHDYAHPVLNIASDRVSRIRLLGYAKPNKSSSSLAPNTGATKRANYVIYEIALSDPSDQGAGPLPLVDLFFGEDRLLCGAIKNWSETSVDFQFASTIAAAGMLLSETPDTGTLTADSLSKLIAELEQTKLTHKQHTQALPTLKRVTDLLRK